MGTTTNKPGSNALERDLEALLTYALGITTERPALTALGVESDQAAVFIRDFMKSHGLAVARRQAPPGMEPITPRTASERARAIGIIEVCRAANRPGEAAGMIAEGVTVAEALARMESPAVEDVEAMLRDLTKETESTWQTAWNASAALKREFGGCQGDFMAFMRARRRGLC